MVFSGVRVTRCLIVCVCFVDRCLWFCTFSFGHCVVCSSSKYEFWLPLWYLQTILCVQNSEVKCYGYINMKTIISGIISIVFNLVWSISCTYTNEVNESSSSIRYTFSIKCMYHCVIILWLIKVRKTNRKILRFASVWVPNMLKYGVLFICKHRL